MMSLQQITHTPSMGVPDMRSTQFDIMKPLPPTLPSLSSNLSAPPKRKRSDSKGSIKPSKVVKKSSSTPNMAKSQDSGSGDEKKRNKLGYHRTSVACGHCRRRKIRCMMPDDDPTGRCSNCIRLKKECNFFPVDSSMSGKGPNPRAASLPKAAGLRTSSPSSMMFNGAPGYPEAYQPYGHTSYSVPPPEVSNGLGLFNTSTAPTFTETPYTSSYEIPATSYESTPYALPPLSAADQSPYGYGLSVSPAPQPYPRPPSTFRPSPFPDAQHTPISQSRTPTNEIGWGQPTPHQPAGMAPHQRFSPSPHSVSASARESEQPPSLTMSSETSSTPTLSEPTTLGSMSAPTVGYWNPYGTTEALEPVKPFVAPFVDTTDSWYSTEPTPLNSY